MRLRILFISMIVASLFFSGLILFTPIGHPMLQSMFPVGEVGSVVWKEIRLENKAARYLVCPGYDLCEDLNDRTAIFDAPVSRLFDE